MRGKNVKKNDQLKNCSISEDKKRFNLIYIKPWEHMKTSTINTNKKTSILNLISQITKERFAILAPKRVAYKKEVCFVF